MDILPSDLERYYSEAIKRIEKQGDLDCYFVKRVISFIFCAGRPLIVDEVCLAFAAEIGDNELFKDAYPV